jgi:hypothetical protein
MLKKIILGLKFYLELNSLGERKMTPNEKFEMHFVHFIFSCFPTVVLGTMVFTTSPKSFEYKLGDNIYTLINNEFYFYCKNDVNIKLNKTDKFYLNNTLIENQTDLSIPKGFNKFKVDSLLWNQKENLEQSIILCDEQLKDLQQKKETIISANHIVEHNNLVETKTTKFNESKSRISFLEKEIIRFKEMLVKIANNEKKNSEKNILRIIETEFISKIK